MLRALPVLYVCSGVLMYVLFLSCRLPCLVHYESPEVSPSLYLHLLGCLLIYMIVHVHAV